VNADTNPMQSKVDENWRPPSELTRSTPRPVSLKWQGVLVSCLAVAMVCAGAGLAVKLYLDADRQGAGSRLMEEQGATTGGQVTAIGSPRGKEGRSKVDYRYEVDGKAYKSSASVGSKGARQLKADPAIQVRYLPTNPGRSAIVGYEPKPTPPWTSPLVFVSMSLAAVVIFFQIRRQRALLTDGLTALGRVTGGRWVSSGHGGHYTVKYEFKSQDGETRKGAFQGSKRQFGAVGTPLTILYDPDNPKRNTRYPMPFVRIDEW
jgi:hypothetical protein